METLVIVWNKMQEIFAAWKRVMGSKMEKRVAGGTIGKPEGTSSAGRGKPDRLTVDLEHFLQERFEFRFNQLTEETEFREKGTGRGVFRTVNQRALNTFCLQARMEGIACWDRDVSRYILSFKVEEYHPFVLYMSELPDWDGVDRIEELARRVSGGALWVRSFRRWMLALAAQWMGMDSLHANSVAPLLVSRTQGRQKSTFCKMLMPRVLQRYYTDSIDLSSAAQTERKLSQFGLINLDEFDKIPSRRMSQLKNLMQMAGLNIRRAYQKDFSSLPRMASFIGTSNRKDLLSDPSGSRRFVCVEVEQKIDCSAVEHDQLYAQLKVELLAGERYWFTSDEEAEVMASNEAFYKHPVEEDVFMSCFRAATKDEEGQVLSSADIFQQLKKFNPSAMREASAGNFGKVLVALGIERVHTRYGNRFRVVPVGA